LAAGSEARVIVVLGEAIGAHSLYPDMVIDGRTSHPLELHNAFHPSTEDPTGTSSVVLSPPSLGFSPSLLLTQQVGSAPLLGPLALCVAHARAAGALPRGARLAAAVFPPGDAQSASDVALGCLGRMAGASQSASSKARGRQR
ncbi:MAG: hypothetical protein ACO3JL_07390, partial [Myxococcota bacterium]